MSATRKVDFYIGQLEDGSFAATSVAAPFFCFVGKTEDAVIMKAEAALDFYFSAEGTVALQPATKNDVVNFIPRRRVESQKEYCFA